MTKVERRVWILMSSMAALGIKMPRQTIIEEYLKPEERR